MKNIFVSYEIAKQLKEKGFDEPCLKSITETGFENDYSILGAKNWNEFQFVVSIPLWQQVVDWFRNNHKIIIESRPLNTLGWWDALIYNEECERIWRDSGYKTYYEALTKAVEKALKFI